MRSPAPSAARCKDACPTFLTGKPLSLKWVNDGVKSICSRSARTSWPARRTRCRRSWHGHFRGHALACTTCGYCEAACPIEMEHLGKFFRLRQHRVMMDGEFPHELKNVFEAYEATSNPWGLPADTRADWARGSTFRWFPRRRK